MASIAKRPDGRWRARYRDDAGKEHARHFDRKIDARRWLDEVTASQVTGVYVDPKAGRITFGEFFDDWAQRQVWESGTDKAMRVAACSVTFGSAPLGSLRSERSVYLADGLVEMLSVHVAGHCPGDDPARWLFGDKLPPHQNTVGYWWRRACAATGCGAVRLHDLRHFYASGLIAAGCDVVTVQRALGHKSATVTLATYAHLWPTAEDRTRSAVAAMLAETLRTADCRESVTL